MNRKHKLWSLPLIIFSLTLFACNQTSQSDSSSSSLLEESSELTPSTSEPVVTDYQIENGNFETGDLSGWTILSGNAFSNFAISDVTYVKDAIPYNKEGDYFFAGGNEGDEGVMHSSTFTIAGSGYLTLRLGAAYLQALTYVSVVRALDDVEIYRIGNTHFNRPESGNENYRVENMNHYYVDLAPFIGTKAYIKVVDASTTNYGFLTLDDIVTYYETKPDLSLMNHAENIMPVFISEEHIQPQLFNSDFSLKTLQGWTVIGEDGVFKDSHINADNRLSNRPDETKIGVLRSSAFKVMGVSIVSFRLGATKHKQTTYLSIKKTRTNEEIYRTYSDRWKEIDEEATHLYYVDLSVYHGENIYLEFVDNSRGDWGLLTIEKIQTYYAEMPHVNDEIAYNLLEKVNSNPSFAAMRAYIDPHINAIEDKVTRTTVQKTFYATIDGISNNKGNWPSVVKYYPNGNNFIITGDIDAMWLRDSSAQVLPYLQFMKIDEDVQLFVKGLLRKQFELIRRNQYANAFNEDGSVFELKFEIDSLMYPLWLAYEYWQITKDDSIFDQFFLLTLQKVIETIEKERNHDDSNYRINNEGDRNAGPHDVNLESGLIWSGYRPSDDVNYYKFFVPGNMFAVATFEKMSTLLATINKAPTVSATLSQIASDVRTAIETYATYLHPTYGRIYAFEVNGYSSDETSLDGKLLMDAANIPSLLSIPWLGYADVNDPIYQNTRAFILSDENPYYYEGTYASGIGDPHDEIGGPNPHKHIPVPWHMAIAMQGLTSTNPEEIETMIEYMTNTTAGTYVMHEAFNANNPHEYSRDWFTWPCALYAHLYVTKILNIDLTKEAHQ